MADAAVSILIQSLRQSITAKEDLLAGLKDKLKWIAVEIETIMPRIESIEALPQVTEDVAYMMERYRDVIHQAEDLIETYSIRVDQHKMAAKHKKPVYWFKLRAVAKEMDRVRDEFAVAKDMLLKLESPEFVVIFDRTTVDQDVPYHLRRFIYYLLLFPVESEISIRRLILLWVAEGLVPVEDIALRYLNELVDRGVVRITSKKRNGKAKACQLMDESVRNTWLHRAKEAKFLEDRNQRVRRLVDHHRNQEGASFIHINNGNPISPHSKYKEVISFLSFNDQRGEPAGAIGNFLQKCISAECLLWLKVLDLERVFRPKLPKVLGRLTLLSYLGLRRTRLDNLPDFLNKFLKLVVLDLTRTDITVLSRSVWNMRYLRHLYLNEGAKLEAPPSGVTLPDLQTLWGASIDETTAVTDGLDVLKNIRKLGLSCCWSRSTDIDQQRQQLHAVQGWISQLQFLESLRIKSRDEHGRASDLHLTSLESNKNLTTVYLLGKLDLSVVSTFPRSLTHITLSLSMFDQDPMKFLESLPDLESLQLRGMSVVYMLHCSRGGFPRLKVLRIWKLEYEVELKVEEGAMPCLEEMEIRSCPGLRMFPDNLQHVNTISLNNMPRGFVDRTKENQPQLWDKITVRYEHI